jgi:hypothetical protein
LGVSENRQHAMISMPNAGNAEGYALSARYRDVFKIKKLRESAARVTRHHQIWR